MKPFKLLLFAFLSFNFIFGTWQDELRNKIILSSPPDWMIAQIRQDLESYKLSEKLNLTLPENALPGDIALFKIRNGKVEFAINAKATKQMNIVRANRFKNHLEKLGSVCQLPDVTFPLFVWDIYDNFCVQWKPRHYKPSVFLFSRKNSESGILVPDVQCLDGFFRFKHLIIEEEQKLSWDKKISMAFWRGAVRGGLPQTIEQLKKTHRFRLVILSKSFPGELDAFFSNNANMKKLRPFIAHHGLVRKWASISDHLKYKYQILIDGNVSSWGRGLWQLLSNCVVFKVDSPYIQWYYRALKPYEHYIPVQWDSSDLIEKIRWAKKFDNKSFSIAQNATNFARDNLSYADMLYYIYLVLSEFAKIEN